MFNKALTVFHKLLTETNRTAKFWEEFRLIREQYLSALQEYRKESGYYTVQMIDKKIENLREAK